MPLSRTLRRGERMTTVPSTSVAVIVGRLHGLPAIIDVDVPESADLAEPRRRDRITRPVRVSSPPQETSGATAR